MEESPDRERREVAVLVISVLVISVCAIVYELLISSLSSYLLGSSVLHFSLTIGLFMSFMGVGSYLSKFLGEDLHDSFVLVEAGVGLIGGLSAFVLYLSFSLTEYYYLFAFLLIAGISILVGLEIPIVLRIVRRHDELKNAVANVLTVDYLGALVASILFPLVLLPYLGIMKTAFLVGLLNLAVATVCIVEFKPRLRHYSRYLMLSAASSVVFLGGFVYSFRVVDFFEKFIYQDQIIYTAQTPYQRIVLTRFRDDLRLFLNGSIQFSSIDEHRYHEPLVHIPLGLVRNREHLVVLGGGDGLVVREILKYPDVKKITVVDIDPEMVRIAREHPLLRAQNKNSLASDKVTVLHQDAYRFMEESSELFSAVIIDLPDPNDLTLGKLYSREFYELIKKRLAADGVVVTQSSSPYFAREPFWSINHTLQEVFPTVLPYSAYVPSFGSWGFNLAANRALDPSRIELPPKLRFLTAALLPTLFVFDRDTAEIPAEVNRLDNQILVQLYQQSWENWN